MTTAVYILAGLILTFAAAGLIIADRHEGFEEGLKQAVVSIGWLWLGTILLVAAWLREIL